VAWHAAKYPDRLAMTTTISAAGVRIAGFFAQAVIFDFNGTLTHAEDEATQYQVYAEVFAEEVGIHLNRDEFLSRMTGRADPEIIAGVLNASGIPVNAELSARIAQRRVARYLHRVLGTAPPLRPGAVALVHALAGGIPLAVVTGAPRAEVVPILAAARPLHLFRTIVTSDDVARGKPCPDGYLLALGRLRADMPGLGADEVVVFEDAATGVEAAHAAGMRIIAAHLPAGVRPERADYIAGVLDETILR